MIVLTFLGTVSGIPSLERNHPAIVLEYYTAKKDTLLFDCGEGTQLQLMRAGISFMQIGKIFITHWHADHFAGLIPLIQTMNLEKRRRELVIFAPEAEKFVSSLLNLGYFGLRFPLKAVEVPFEGNNVNKVFETRDYEILSIPVLHTVPTVAYCFKERDRWRIDLAKLRSLGLKRGRWLKRLKARGKISYRGRVIRIENIASKKRGLKVVYTGDTKPCHNVEKIAADADLLIHDGTFFEEGKSKGKYHANMKEAAKVALKAGVRQLVLTHISRRYEKVDLNELEREVREIFSNARIAHDFMRIELR